MEKLFSIQQLFNFLLFFLLKRKLLPFDSFKVFKWSHLPNQPIDFHST